MELRALLTALLSKVARFDLVESSLVLDNATHGFATCTRCFPSETSCPSIGTFTRAGPA